MKNKEYESLTDETYMTHLISIQLSTTNNDMVDLLFLNSGWVIQWTFEIEHPVLFYFTETERLLSKWTCDLAEEVGTPSRLFHTLNRASYLQFSI